MLHLHTDTHTSIKYIRKADFTANFLYQNIIAIEMHYSDKAH
jgi:hypothetical protein